MKEKFLGTFEFGYEYVDLFCTEDQGGAGRWGGSHKRASIIIGLNYSLWRMVATVLLHEAMELAFWRSKKILEPRNAYGNVMSSVTIVCDHLTFEECCERAAEFMVAALPVLAKEWNQFRKKQK